MNRIYSIILYSLTAILLVGCAEGDDLETGDNRLPNPDEFISVAITRAGGDDDGWMLLPLPGQQAPTVKRDGKDYEVPRNIGIFGYYVDANVEHVTNSPRAIVFDNDILEAYSEANKYPGKDDVNVSEDPEVREKRKQDIFDKTDADFNAGVGERQPDGTIKYKNGIIENEKGEIIYEPSDNNTNAGMDAGNGGSSSPARPQYITRAVTRSNAEYDDENDKYFYGYHNQYWAAEDYMFYAYAPASRNASFGVESDGTINGRFVWDKIPCVSTTDYVVAREEVWRKNKTQLPDRSRIHFDGMQHLMSRIRLYFAVHPDFDKIRKVVVTQASLSFQEEGFKKVYTFSNERNVLQAVDGKELPWHDKVNGNWKWTADPQYVYNPRYNRAFYNSWVEAPPSDMVCYQTRNSTTSKLGKLLFPLDKVSYPADKGWSQDNLFTDFYVVPFKDNKTNSLTLHVEYIIYDINVDDPLGTTGKETVDGHEMRLFRKEHLLRECKRQSTITFKSPMKFESGVSHALRILINPDYIYVLSDHDEPADLIIK